MFNYVHFIHYHPCSFTFSAAAGMASALLPSKGGKLSAVPCGSRLVFYQWPAFLCTLFGALPTARSDSSLLSLLAVLAWVVWMTTVFLLCTSCGVFVTLFWLLMSLGANWLAFSVLLWQDVWPSIPLRFFSRNKWCLWVLVLFSSVHNSGSAF